MDKIQFLKGTQIYGMITCRSIQGQFCKSDYDLEILQYRLAFGNNNITILQKQYDQKKLQV